MISKSKANTLLGSTGASIGNGSIDTLVENTDEFLGKLAYLVSLSLTKEGSGSRIQPTHVENVYVPIIAFLDRMIEIKERDK
jgi:hypothetical protein